MTYEIKIKEAYADAIVDGRKNFEVRYNDRGYNAGDLVQFQLLMILIILYTNQIINFIELLMPIVGLG